MPRDVLGEGFTVKLAAGLLELARQSETVGIPPPRHSLVWRKPAPELGSRLAITLRPGNCVFEQLSTCRPAFPQQFALTVDSPGARPSWKTPIYVLRAPPRPGWRPNPNDPLEPIGPLTPKKQARFKK